MSNLSKRLAEAFISQGDEEIANDTKARKGIYKEGEIKFNGKWYFSRVDEVTRKRCWVAMSILNQVLIKKLQKEKITLDDVKDTVKSGTVYLEILCGWGLTITLKLTASGVLSVSDKYHDRPEELEDFYNLVEPIFKQFKQHEPNAVKRLAK
jgi:hypothetical protein